MKKIIIFYAKYGGGHLSAAKSISDYLEKNYGDIVEVQLIDCMLYINKLINNITTKAYTDMAKKVPKLWGKLYTKSEKGIISKISTDWNKLMAKKLYKLIKSENPDFIISTHPFSSQMCGYLKKKNKINCKIATIMTDHATHDQWLVFNEYIDYLFVSNEKMKKDLLKKEISPDKILVTGIPISTNFLNNYNKEEIFNEFKLNPNKKTILFFGGGEFGLGKTKTVNIFKALIENNYDIQIIAISGKNKQMKENFENIILNSNKETTVRIFEYTNKVPELMSISSLVITKPGGLTTSESLASELPLLIINPIPGQEEENAKYLEENGVAIWLKDDMNENEILNNLLYNSTKLLEMKKCTKLIEKKHSTENICNILITSIK